MLNTVLRIGTSCAVLLLLHIVSARAEPTAAVRQQAAQTQALLTQLKGQIDARKFADARKQYAAARAAAEQLVEQADGNDAGTRLLLGPVRRRLAELHGALVLEGFELEPLSARLKPPPEAPPRIPPKKPAVQPKPLVTASTKPADGSISFRTQVAPLLATHCVRCHSGAKPKGQFNSESFAALMQGVEGAAVIDAGKSSQSRLIEIIASGEMPKGKQKMPAAELAVLSKWIDQGARFDGDDPSQSLAKLAPAVKPMPSATPNPPMPLPATPAGPPAFSTHVAPVLAAQCIKCHGGRQPRNRLSVESFAQLMRGGMTGKAILPDDAAGSLLVQKLKGTAKDGQRMPLDSDPLPPEQIAAIEQWIAAGAKFDGPNPARPLAEVIALGAARGATHEELSRQRAAAAAKNWSLAIPDDASRSLSTENFLVIGNVPQPRLEGVAAEAERLAGVIRSALALPANKPLVHGRLTIYAMAHRYDYTEFALMVEQRSRLLTGQMGHWRYTIADAYALVVAAEKKQDESSDLLTPLLAQQITAATVASRWQVPPWLAEGIGRAMSAEVAPTSPLVAAWDDRLKQLRAENPAANDWLAGKLPLEDAETLGYGLARQLMTGGTKMKSLAAGLERKQPLDEALKRSHGRPLAELAANWLASPLPKGVKKGGQKAEVRKQK